MQKEGVVFDEKGENKKKSDERLKKTLSSLHLSDNCDLSVINQQFGVFFYFS